MRRFLALATLLFVFPFITAPAAKADSPQSLLVLLCLSPERNSRCADFGTIGYLFLQHLGGEWNGKAVWLKGMSADVVMKEPKQGVVRIEMENVQSLTTSPGTREVFIGHATEKGKLSGTYTEYRNDIFHGRGTWYAEIPSKKDATAVLEQLVTAAKENFNLVQQSEDGVRRILRGE